MPLPPQEAAEAGQTGTGAHAQPPLAQPEGPHPVPYATHAAPAAHAPVQPPSVLPHGGWVVVVVVGDVPVVVVVVVVVAIEPSAGAQRIWAAAGLTLRVPNWSVIVRAAGSAFGHFTL